MNYDPASKIEGLKCFGEFGGVNPSITDSSTYTFLDPATMEEVFDHEMEGCFLYSRHFNPINNYLCSALASMEGTESSHVTASGMGAISSTLLQLCKAGDHIVSSWTIYGGTFAFLNNIVPRFGINVSFVDATNLDALASAVTEKTRVIYCESVSNPLMTVHDIESLARIAKEKSAILVVDNTFSPMILTPALDGADFVVCSLTKFVNGTSDCVAGAICSTKDRIQELMDVNGGMCMLLGPVLDSQRAASILKNLHTLHIRMRQHSKNAMYVADSLNEYGLKVFYPGLSQHPQHKLMKSKMNEEFGFGGMLAIDMVTQKRANQLMVKMQNADVGYLAVSLGYFKTLFSAPSSSTSSEIPESMQREMGLTDGIVRFSIGLDNDIEKNTSKIIKCLKELDG